MIGCGISIAQIAARPRVAVVALPVISISSPSITEGNSGTVQLAFVVTLDKTSASAVTVAYATSNGTATAGTDYTATSGTLTIAAGQTSGTINVPVLGDTTVESNETVVVTLSSPTNATLSGGGSTLAGTGTITNDDVAGAYPFPATASEIARWRAADLPNTVDGSAVTTWTDSIGGAVLTSGVAATYKTNRYGGKPSVLFAGTQWFAGTIAAINNAITAKEFTMIAVFAAPQVGSSLGFLCAANSSTASLRAGGSSAIQTGCQTSNVLIPYAPTGFSTAAYTYTGTYKGTNVRLPCYVNGSLIGTSSSPTAGTTFAIGGNSTGGAGSPYRGELLEVRCYNKRLTLLEIVQFERAIRDSYAQAYPWTAPGYYYAALGDSITAGYGVGTNASPQTVANWPYLQAQRRGLPVGAWSNLGYVGADPADVYAIAQGEGVTGLSAVTGVPTKYSYFEFYNTKGATLSATVAAQQTLLGYLKGTAGDKVVFGTTPDYANRTSAKTDYCAYWDTSANRTGYMDSYVPIHLDPNIGVDGACPSGLPYGAYFANNIGGNATLTVSTTSGSNQINVTAASGTALAVGFTLSGVAVGIPLGAYITALGTGTGGVGTYTISTNATASTSGAVAALTGDNVHLGFDGAAAMAPLWDVIGTV